MKLTKIASIIAAAAFGLTANTALAQGGYGALSYFDWSVDQSGLSKEEQPQRHRGFKRKRVNHKGTKDTRFFVIS